MLFMGDKIIWSEGMVLSPHHLQQAEIQAEAALSQRFQLLCPFGFGFTVLDLDEESIHNGSFSLREAAGIFPDGTSFHFPRLDANLEPRNFDEYLKAETNRPDGGRLGVYIALPALAEGHPNLRERAEPGRPARFSPAPRTLQDMNTGAGPREVLFGQQNLRILFEGESQAGYQVLKVAEIAPDAQGRKGVDPVFIPPCLKISASRPLLAALKRLIEIGIQKSNHLLAQRAQKATGVAQYTAEAVTNYLLLSALNGALPELIHFNNHPSAHPEALFRRLLGLAGGLLNFGETAVDDLPRYAHGDLRSSFPPLFKLLESLLGATVPTGYRHLPLTRTSPVQHAASLRDLDLGRIREVYFGLAAQAPEMDILALVQRKAKIGPLSRIDAIVNSALPGLSLVPEPQPPQSIPAKSGFKYFRLQQAGDLWQQIRDSRALAIHLPSDLPGTRLEMVATLE